MFLEMQKVKKYTHTANKRNKKNKGKKKVCAIYFKIYHIAVLVVVGRIKIAPQRCPYSNPWILEPYMAKMS